MNLLWTLPALGLFFFWSFRNRRRRLEKLVGSSLAPQLTEEFSRGKAILKALLLMGFFTFGILAAARPQWGSRLQTVRRHGVDVIMALDTSYSMNTEDVAPNRLEKAKGEIRRLMEKSEGDRIGLVSFAGNAAVLCPLTLDHGAANLFLDAAATGMIPDPGTSLAAAIETATSAFITKETKYKALVLFTDGEDLGGQVDEAVRKAKEAGVIIYAVGIGTSQGMPIPIRDSKGDVVEYRKDPGGKIVVSSLDERSLAEVAAQTGGRYFRATTSESEIGSLYSDISGLEKKELESRLLQNFEDQFQYPLALAVLFLAAELWISERRKPGVTARQLVSKSPVGMHPVNRRLSGLLLVFTFLLIPAAALNLRAESLASKNKEGNRLFTRGKYEEAEKAYLDAQVNSPGRPEVLYNLGNSLIKQKKFDKGIQALRQSISKGDEGIRENSWYNTGNALFSKGNFKDSSEAFIQALRLNPADKDAKHNLELALLRLKQQEQKQSNSNQKQQNSENPDQDRSQKDNQSNRNQGSSSGQKEQNESIKPQKASSREGFISKDQAIRILEAFRNQELEEQRKLLEHHARQKTGEKDW